MAPKTDFRRIDPFAPLKPIDMHQLPLPALKRWLESNLEVGRSMVPNEGLPIHAIQRGRGRNQQRGIGNLTLPATAVWSPLSIPMRVTVPVSGLRDVQVTAAGTAIASGATSTHGVSITIDGVEYQRFLHAQALNAGNGLGVFTSNLVPWNVWGLLPAFTLSRGPHTFEIVTKLTSGANVGTMFGDANNLINLYVLEQ